METNYIWSSEMPIESLTDTNFYPFRMNRSGYPVGTWLTEVPVPGSGVVTQLHAGYWAHGFMDLTPDPRELRLPMSLPPIPTPFAAMNTLADMNSRGDAVGVASWGWVASTDGRTSWLWRGPFRQATLWAAPNRTPFNFGDLQQTGNESSFQAMNDAGDIVGVSSLIDPDFPGAEVTHAIRSHVSLAETIGNKLTDLGTLGGLYSAAISINSDGIAAGYSTVSPEDSITNARAVYWLPAEARPLPLPGYGEEFLSYARQIDDRNQVVGEAVNSDGIQQAVLWIPGSAWAEDFNYSIINLNDFIRSPEWLLYTARSINRAGRIVGSGYHTTEIVLEDGSRQRAMAPRVFLLIPGSSLAVDYNRDGSIELSDKDDLLPGQPYQFWVNDDSDGSAVDRFLGISDLPGARSGAFEFDLRDPDYADGKVNGAADLVDWFPVYLNISNLLSVLPASRFEYRLVQAEGALNVLYTGLRPDQAGSYLKQELASGFGPEFNQPAATAQGVQEVTPDGVALEPEFLSKITSGKGGVLLFEARHGTTMPLRLEVRDGQKLLTVLELPLEISNAEAMYGWANIRPAAGQAPERDSDFMPRHWPAFAHPDQAFVFLHGYNVNERQSRAWAAEMFKRLWWSGSRHRFYGVSWHGDETQIAGQTTVNYHVNVRHAFESARTLAYVLTNLLADADVTVAAHSLGNMIVCSAIQDCGATPNRFYMVDAAIAMEAFDEGLTSEMFMTHPDWKPYPERLFASEWHDLFPSEDGRRSLTWRGRFQDVPRRTRLYNFYSSGEEVLENRLDDSDPWVTDILSLQLQLPAFRSPVNWLMGRFAWASQELLKGRVTVGDMMVLEAAECHVGGLPAFLALELSDVESGTVMGSQYGGWGFNAYWDVTGSFVTVNAVAGPSLMYLPGTHRAPTTSTAIPATDLASNPFFLPFPDPRLTTSDGASLALDPSVRAQLLSEAIPARTFAAGANAFRNLPILPLENQIDMNLRFERRGWPLERLSDSRNRNRWKHSDIHDVPFLWTSMAFERWVALGANR